MSDIKKDGGPAFPIPLAENQAYQGHAPCDGMTLRDYFAGQELAKVDCVEVNDVPGAYDRFANHCYRMADAMLRARGAA